MKVYFAHPTETYGTLMELRALDLIKGFFGSVEVVNPSDYSGVSHGDMSFFYNLVDGCDALVFTLLAGFVTFGVVNEVKYALDHGKDVYYLDWRLGDFKKVNVLSGFVELDFKDTNLLYDFLVGSKVDEVEFTYRINRKLSSGASSRVSALHEVIDDYSNDMIDRYSSIEEDHVRESYASLGSISRFHHWWAEDKTAEVKIDSNVFRGIIDEKMREHGVNSLYSLYNKLGLPHRRHARCYWIYTGRTRRPSIRTLIRICDELDIPYYYLEKKNLFMGRYPYDLGNPALWKALVHVVNEGHLHHHPCIVEYSNMDPVLHQYFKKTVEASGGVFHKPKLKMGRIFVSRADSFTARRLHMIGLQYGRKVLYQPNINFRVLPDWLWRYYVSSTLTEDGYAILSFDRTHGRLKFYYGWARSVDITDYVPKDVISVLDKGKILYIDILHYF